MEVHDLNTGLVQYLEPNCTQEEHSSVLKWSKAVQTLNGVDFELFGLDWTVQT